MSLLHKRMVQSRPWARARRAALDRDNWRCTKCGRAGRLEVHHRTPLKEDPEQNPYALHGLAALCRSCHFKTTANQNRKRPPGPQADGWRDLVGEPI